MHLTARLRAGPRDQIPAWPIDPAIIVARDIRTADGNLIAAKGTRLNPLSVMRLRQPLMFIDGRDRTSWTGR